jgi:hypothetical protein
MFRVKETIARGVCVEVGMKLIAEPTHENMLGGTELVKLPKINHKSLFS